MNHTGVHLLNHAIRQNYGSEDSIIQVQSLVRDDSLKFEFKFNDLLDKPDDKMLRSIQETCQTLISAGLDVHVSDQVEWDDEKVKEFELPLRKLNDILYPRSVRVVSLGAKWDQFLKTKLNKETGNLQ
jgi:alanyl-tRNA synthetase